MPFADYLPVQISTTGGRVLELTNILEEEISEVYNMVQSIVGTKGRSDMPFGKHEYPEEWLFRELLSQSFTILVKDHGVSEDKPRSWRAVIILAAPNFQRTYHAATCDLFLLIPNDHCNLSTYEQYVQVSLECAVGLGAHACLANPFITNTMATTALGKQGFLPVGCIPDSGYVEGYGSVSAQILYKQIQSYGGSPPDLRSNRICQLGIRKKSLSPMLKPRPQYASNIVLPPCLTFRCHYINQEYVEKAAQMFLDTINRSDGYVSNDFPQTLEGFKRWLLDYKQCHVIVAIEATTGKLAAVFGNTQSDYQRNYNTEYLDGFVVVDSSLAHKGLASTLLSDHVVPLLHSLGFKGVCTDIFSDNIPSIILNNKHKSLIVATIPKGAWFSEKGWKDVFIVFDSYQKKYSRL